MRYGRHRRSKLSQVSPRAGQVSFKRVGRAQRGQRTAVEFALATRHIYQQASQNKVTLFELDHIRRIARHFLFKQYFHAFFNSNVPLGVRMTVTVSRIELVIELGEFFKGGAVQSARSLDIRAVRRRFRRRRVSRRAARQRYRRWDGFARTAGRRSTSRNRPA